MTGRIADIDLDDVQSLRCVLSSDADALIVRYEGQVVGFTMLHPHPDTRRTRSVTRLFGEIGATILAEKLAAELAPRSAGSQVPSLTIAICTRDRPQLLKRCLDSLMCVSLKEEWGASSFEILVVDNASAGDETEVVTHTFSGVAYAQERCAGLNFARNRALQIAETDYIAFLDDDVVADPGWLEGFRGALAVHPDAMAVTGQVLPFELATPAQVLFERRGGFRHGFSQLRYTAATEETDDLYPCRTGIFGVGCNMVFNREYLLEMGGFDEALDTGPPLPGGGDHDIFYRVVRHGGPLVYEPCMVVHHQHRETMALMRHQYWTWGLSVMALASKWYREDPKMRDRWRRLICRWFRSQTIDLLRSMVGRHALPPVFLGNEILGGLVGLCGEYGRSKRRSLRIKGLHS